MGGEGPHLEFGSPGGEGAGYQFVVAFYVNGVLILLLYLTRLLVFQSVTGPLLIFPIESLLL